MHIYKKSKEIKSIPITELSNDEAKIYFFENDSYCNFSLPPYINFNKLLNEINIYLYDKELNEIKSGKIDEYETNYTILNNKDGKYAWRRLQLVHPVLYVALVQAITKDENWNLICSRFIEFKKNEKIKCVSIPVKSLKETKNKAEQVNTWLKLVEQQSLILSLDFNHIFITDISNCYPSIYTHSIAWALHGKPKAKKHRNDLSMIGNLIDLRIREMSYGQTNGIPQGSTLMDFVAEMVLGYSDTIVSKKIESVSISDYCILRYRDDYRVFVNNPVEGEMILKIITEVLTDLGLKLNPHKTSISNDIVMSSYKKDKLQNLFTKAKDTNEQNHLLKIYCISKEAPNSGTLTKELQAYHKKLSRRIELKKDPLPLISIIVNIAINNPRVYDICAAIISILINQLPSSISQNDIFLKILKKFKNIPNTNYLLIWLQRIVVNSDCDYPFDDPICRIVSGEEDNIWNCDWISSKKLITIFTKNKIVDKDIISELNPFIQPEEVELFDAY